MVFHSSDFGVKLSDLLERVPPVALSADSESPSVVVVGGGKSAQECAAQFLFVWRRWILTTSSYSIAAYLANEGRKVTIVCPNFDGFLAASKPLPAWVRESR